VIKIGVFKCGNIGTAPVLELLLDELADRKDITVRTVTTGSKMGTEVVEESVEKIFQFSPNLLLLASPNTSAPGPAKAREILSKKGIPTIVFTDGPGKRVRQEMETQGLGYMILEGDPLIGARKEFLDPTEMAIFNGQVIAVLATTGIFRKVVQRLDKVILDLANSEKLELPRMVLDTHHIRDGTDFVNPYARVKAMAAYELLKKAAEINVRACFIEKDRDKYIPLVACAHEIVQTSVKLAITAREIEKQGDMLLRTPHGKSGKIKKKRRLMDQPQAE
jgi:methylenetetrahydromethanopterin dehydrogenase